MQRCETQKKLFIFKCNFKNHALGKLDSQKPIKMALSKVGPQVAEPLNSGIQFTTLQSILFKSNDENHYNFQHYS